VKVAVNIVTFNSEHDVGICLESIWRHNSGDHEVHIIDNASSDGTAKVLDAFDVDYIQSSVNLGFCAAHNELIKRFQSDYVLFLNPDTMLQWGFIEELVRALEARPDAASAGGKLLRMDGKTIDSTGIIMLREQRHLDRGAGEQDHGQFDEPGDIFGPSAAAALYRREALEDVAIDGQYFDEDFFAYREDADLAWRCQLMGWKSIYVPTAVAWHRRRVTPERRSQLPWKINYHSVKNRFLLRINNMPADQYRRDLWPITKRDLAVIGYVFLREWLSVPALWYLTRNLRRLLRKRELIQSRRRVTDADLQKWFR
jgi:GT2 family glycosyltransferase